MNFVAKTLRAGGSITPLLISPSEFPTKGTGLFNPSIYKDGDNILCNVRHCQYTILHSEWGRFEHQWGPLVYLCPEDDLTLTTTNYMMTFDGHLNLKSTHRVDTSKLDVKPIWDFVGLEDARVVRWDGKLYMTGVRRDTTTNGQGRMELSEIQMGDDNVLREVSRWRIPAPGKDDTYCEKNWMPVVDMPFHYIKWTNPTELVKVDPEAKTCTSVFVGEHKTYPINVDFRGGSQVIPFGKYRIAITHLLTKFHKSEAGRKNAQYRHAFVVWDENWKCIKLGEIFDFMGGEIEFCCGMTEHNGNFLVTFGFQDNAAYMLNVPRVVIEEYVHG